MICPGCSRENHPNRRYCGRCGVNFQPNCRRCSFANDPSDRFCGGCGAVLVASEGVSLKRAVAGHVAAPPVPAVKTAAVPPAAIAVAVAVPDELSGLFATKPVANDEPDIPATGVEQDDLDRLFGAVPS